MGTQPGLPGLPGFPAGVGADNKPLVPQQPQVQLPGATPGAPLMMNPYRPELVQPQRGLLPVQLTVQQQVSYVAWCLNCNTHVTVNVLCFLMG